MREKSVGALGVRRDEEQEARACCRAGRAGRVSFGYANRIQPEPLPELIAVVPWLVHRALGQSSAGAEKQKNTFWFPAT